MSPVFIWLPECQQQGCCWSLRRVSLICKHNSGNGRAGWAPAHFPAGHSSGAQSSVQGHRQGKQPSVQRWVRSRLLQAWLKGLVVPFLIGIFVKMITHAQANKSKKDIIHKIQVKHFPYQINWQQVGQKLHDVRGNCFILQSELLRRKAHAGTCNHWRKECREPELWGEEKNKKILNLYFVCNHWKHFKSILTVRKPAGGRMWTNTWSPPLLSHPVGQRQTLRDHETAS